MNKYYQLFFSPLQREWCSYYQILMHLTFFAFVMSIIMCIGHYFVANKKNRLSVLCYLNKISQLGISYFVTRLLYSMCIR
jgi:hypothetical protein